MKLRFSLASIPVLLSAFLFSIQALAVNGHPDDLILYDGPWGGWSDWKSYRSNWFICGAQVRFEGNLGGGDDTAANGLRVKFCNFFNWYEQSGWETVANGLYGSWGDQVMCSPNKYVDGGNVRAEGNQDDGDDTSLNGLKLHCVDRSDSNGEYKLVEDGLWGGWHGWQTAPGKLCYSAVVKVEGGQGDGDDTGMNSIAFRCTPIPPTPRPTTPPTPRPTQRPTPRPTPVPTQVPTPLPTPVPTQVPTPFPTPPPTESPTSAPVTAAPTAAPTSAPTTGTPTAAPTDPIVAGPKSMAGLPAPAPKSVAGIPGPAPGGTTDGTGGSGRSRSGPAPAPKSVLTGISSKKKVVGNHEFSVLPPPDKPAVEPVTFKEMTNAPKGLVSDTGVCTSVNEDLEFVAVDCSAEGCIQLNYEESTRHMKLVSVTGNGRLLAHGSHANTNQLCLKNMQGGKSATFAACGNDVSLQWSNAAPGKIQSEVDGSCLSMPSAATLDPSKHPGISTETCAPVGATEEKDQTWKFQVEPQVKNGVLTGSSSGDPHFKTWCNEKFDFHGACDLVLVESPRFANGQGMRIHIRTKPEAWWSYIESAVIQIGTQMIELKGGQSGEGPHYWVNGMLGSHSSITDDSNVKSMVEELRSSLDFPLFQIHYKHVSAKQHKIRIDLPKGDAISVGTYKEWVAVNIKAGGGQSENFAGSMGLMGRYPDGFKIGRDHVTNFTETDAFGKEWQVLASEPMLFHSAEGVVQSPQECVMPTEASAKKRRLGEAAVSRADAVAVCTHASSEEVTACVYDVLASNDLDVAGAYWPEE